MEVALTAAGLPRVLVILGVGGDREPAQQRVRLHRGQVLLGEPQVLRRVVLSRGQQEPLEVGHGVQSDPQAAQHGLGEVDPPPVTGLGVGNEQHPVTRRQAVRLASRVVVDQGHRVVAFEDPADEAMEQRGVAVREHGDDDGSAHAGTSSSAGSSQSCTFPRSAPAASWSSAR